MIKNTNGEQNNENPSKQVFVCIVLKNIILYPIVSYCKHFHAIVLISDGNFTEKKFQIIAKNVHSSDEDNLLLTRGDFGTFLIY